MTTLSPLSRKERKPVAIDLFCGAGGVTKGLQMAGFDVHGVDAKEQPRYCGEVFSHADAMTFPLDGFDFIWASPPCQAFTIAGRKQRNEGTVYADLVAGTRARLIATGKPWVIENVPGSPLRGDLMLCGSNFGLPIVRHRIFEANFSLGLGTACSHARGVITICGHGTPSWMRRSRISKGLSPNTSVDMKREAMGIPWMNRDELSQAIPPAYSEYIGRMAIAEVKRRAQLVA